MAQPIGRTTDPPMGQPNLAGRSVKIEVAACLFVPLGAYIVGLPLWAYVAWFALTLAGLAAVTWHFRRRSLRPLERWALAPKRFTGMPSAAWAALTIAALLALVLVAIWSPLALGTVGLVAYFASRTWAWKVITDRQP